MGDEAHVGLVDAHAESDGGDHHHVLRRNEGGLVARPDPRVEPGMVGQHPPPAGRELLGQLLRFVAARHVDDPRPRLLRHQRLQLRADAVARADVVADVGPVEAGDDEAVVRNAELDEYVLARRLVGRGGESEARHVGKGVEQGTQQAVVGPKIVTPFGHAMGLVDSDQRERRALGQAAEAVGARPLGGDIEEVELAPAEPRQRLLAVAVGRGKRSGADAESVGGADLVVHQSDERGDDQSGPLPCDCRHLVTERLARAGRHDGKAVLARHDAPDHLLLHAAEGGEAESLAEDVEGRGHRVQIVVAQGRGESHRHNVEGTKVELNSTYVAR